jgi:hypothetical protein
MRQREGAVHALATRTTFAFWVALRRGNHLCLGASPEVADKLQGVGAGDAIRDAVLRSLGFAASVRPGDDLTSGSKRGRAGACSGNTAPGLRVAECTGPEGRV